MMMKKILKFLKRSVEDLKKLKNKINNLYK